MNKAVQNAHDFIKTVDFSFYGLAFFYAWFSMLMSQRLAAEPLDGISISFFDFGLCGIYLLFLLARNLTVKPDFMKRCARWGCLACIVGTVFHLVFLAAGIRGAYSTIVVLVICGMGFSLVTLVWKCMYCHFGPAQVALVFCGSKLISDVLVIALDGYNQTYYAVAFMVVVVVGSLCLKRGLGRSLQLEPVCKSVQLPRVAKLLLLCGVYGLAYGYGSAGQTSYLAIQVIDACFCLFVLGLFLFWRRFDFVFLYQIALPAVIVSFLLVPAIPAIPPGISQCANRIGYSAILIYTTILMCNLCRDNAFNPVLLFSMSGLIVHVSIRAGGMLPHFMHLVGSDAFNEGALVVTLVCGAVIASLLILSERPLSSSWNLSRPDAVRDEFDAYVHAKTLSIWKTRYGLTSREEELLSLLVHGRSIDEIASDLFIAKGTVKAHIQHIYRKAGVHSKEELMERFSDGTH